jgi:ATP-dependent RNA helicase DeaD
MSATRAEMISFNELPLNPSLLLAIQEMGFETPSPIQAEAIPLLLAEETDFLGLAATGTGKTAAFGLPLLHRLDPSLRTIQAIVLCPTRELAIQVSEQLNLLGKHLFPRGAAVPVYGGASYRDQIRGIQKGTPIVVGTPGRVLDHIEQGTLSLSEARLVVLDEADEMISMGFREAIEAVLSSIPPETRKTWLFSATMDKGVRPLVDEFLSDPAVVEINRKEMLPDTIEQVAFITHEGNKPEVLCKLIDAADAFYGLIFCQTKALVADCTDFLRGRGYAVDCLHGEKDQNARERTLKAFRERRVSILVCTDVASRGIDVKDVTHVINYSIPRELDNYVHRIGRTGRSGKTGFAFSLVAPAQRGMISRVERLTKRKITEGKIPTRKEIGLKKIAALLPRWNEVPNADRATELLNAEWKAALALLTPEQIAARFLALQLPEVFVVETPTAPAGRAARNLPQGEVLAAGPRKEIRMQDLDSARGRPERPSRGPRFDRGPARREEDRGFSARKTYGRRDEDRAPRFAPAARFGKPRTNDSRAEAPRFDRPPRREGKKRFENRDY